MNIFIGNISYEVTDEDLRREFGAYGAVASVAIMKDGYNGQSRGFGFIDMPKFTEGQAAINGLNGKKIKGRVVTVNSARPRTSGRVSNTGSHNTGSGSSLGHSGGYMSGKGGTRRY